MKKKNLLIDLISYIIRIFDFPIIQFYFCNDFLIFQLLIDTKWCLFPFNRLITRPIFTIIRHLQLIFVNLNSTKNNPTKPYLSIPKPQLN